jgi:hypothetical protein
MIITITNLVLLIRWLPGPYICPFLVCFLFYFQFLSRSCHMIVVGRKTPTIAKFIQLYSHIFTPASVLNICGNKVNSEKIMNYWMSCSKIS